MTDTFDEPIERVDVAAFAARTLAVRVHERLAAHGLAATRLEIAAVTGDGQQLSRTWRHDGILTAQAIADRTRWQLDGWLTRGQITSGVTTLTLIPRASCTRPVCSRACGAKPAPTAPTAPPTACKACSARTPS